MASYIHLIGEMKISDDALLASRDWAVGLDQSTKEDLEILIKQVRLSLGGKRGIPAGNNNELDDDELGQN